MTTKTKKPSDNYTQLCKEIADIEEYIKKDLVKVIRIKKNTKRPTTNKWNEEDSPLDKLQTHKGNYGIIIGHNHSKNGKSIAGVDIDGIKVEDDNLSDTEKEKIKQQTKEYIYECLKELKHREYFREMIENKIK